MPAETHQRSEVVANTDVVELLATVLGLPDVDGTLHDTSLAALGCNDDLTLLDLWDAAVEEYGERTVAEADLDELRAAGTLGGLAALIVAACGSPVPADGREGAR